MNIFKIFNPHNPDNFRFKIVESWFSENYIHFKYSVNGGITWKYIHRCSLRPDIMTGYFTWERISLSLGDGDFEYEKNKFSSYQKILDYEKLQSDEGDKNNTRIKKDKMETSKRRKDALKKANKKD